MNRFLVRKAAVLGAGVMGAQIAAHLVNVGVPVILYDLPARDAPKNATVLKALAALAKAKPAPLALADDARSIEPANYDDDLARLGECELVIEAIAERLDVKRELYRKVAPHLAPQAIFASNTSGLSIAALADALPEPLRPRFAGLHFFNPPRYMFLVELVAAPQTDPAVLDALETFATTTLGKGVVRANDTPNFIANRVGTAGLLATLRHAEAFGLPIDVVDDLTGKKLGRASSGTLRTADLVGLDTLGHVIETMQRSLADDPFHPSFATPPALAALLARGALGQKTGAGFYRKAGRERQRFDAARGDYVPAGGKADALVERILKRPPAERLKLLRESKHPQAQFLWSVLRDGFHYAAVHLAAIAAQARDVDLALRWGFGMREGPFELWQAAGWTQVARWVQDDIDAGRALAPVPLPGWVFDGPVAANGGVHGPEGSWSAAAARFAPRRELAVHSRQRFPERVVGEPATPPLAAGTELYRNDEIRVWTDDGEFVIATLTGKLHLIGPAVGEGLARAVELAEERYRGVVIWSPDDVFSAGANLEALMPVYQKAGAAGIAAEERRLQELMLRLRYAQVPVVAAIRGLGLGGGCELALHCARRVAALESYLGLVEVGVGLIPGGGGLTQLARRAAERAAAADRGGGTPAPLLHFIKDGITNVAMAKVGTSAFESRRLGWLEDEDVIVAHKDELLHVALAQVRALAESGWRPPPRARFPVAGRDAIATVRGQLVNLRDGGFASEHDAHLAALVAEVVCGGDVDAGSIVDEPYLMSLERERFCALLEHPKTQARIMGMLATGKPVRN